ncbi:MAG TPA: PQQ-binding-like beta-propeller repeat protein [Vicinamibacteria bacterium]|nr:PQQ-binding-like beta-propeller repeat protein [Vicinamibacteria bacterium]
MRSLNAAIAIGLAQVVAAEDWPQWRGPLGNGVSREKGLPLRWTEASVSWRATLGGAGVSSPVVLGDRVFVTSQRGAATQRPGSHPKLARGEGVTAEERPLASAGEGPTVFVVEAFQVSDGRRLWERRVPLEGEHAPLHEKHNLASPSPVTDGEHVFAWFGTGQLVALSARDGSLSWQRHLGKELGAFEIGWGHASSPALHGDLLYLLCYHEPASRLLAVDKRSGKTRWTVDRGKDVRSYSTPVVVSGPKGEELVVNSTDRIDAYDPRSGAHLWHAGSSHNFAVPVPAFHEGVLYASRGYRSGPYMAIQAGGRGDVNATHVRWEVPTGAPYVSSLLYYDGLLYMASDAGVVTCVDPSNGQKLWQERTGGIFSASPVAGDGKLYFSSETGEIFVFAPGREPRLLARNPVGGRIVASPAIAGGTLFLRTDEHLVAIAEK